MKECQNCNRHVPSVELPNCRISRTTARNAYKQSQLAMITIYSLTFLYLTTVNQYRPHVINCLCNYSFKLRSVFLYDMRCCIYKDSEFWHDIIMCVSKIRGKLWFYRHSYTYCLIQNH